MVSRGRSHACGARHHLRLTLVITAGVVATTGIVSPRPIAQAETTPPPTTGAPTTVDHLSSPVAVAASPVAPVAVPASPDPSLPRPAVPKNLPVEVERASPYLRQVSCDPVAKPGAVALGKLLIGTYPGTSYGITRDCGVDGIASEHYEGRAVDWMVGSRDPAGSARVAAFLDWLLAPDSAGNAFANARRLGVMYVIWNDRIWGSYENAPGWRAYSTCAAHSEPAWDTSCHRDHVHLSLSWVGALGTTSYWTGRVAPVDYGPCRPPDLNWAAPRNRVNPTPCPVHPAVTAPSGSPSNLNALFRYSGAVVGQGATGPVVRTVQTELGLDADGRFGPATAAAVTGFRRTQKLPASSRVDAVAWRALLKVALASAAPPSAPGGTAPLAPTGGVPTGRAPTGGVPTGGAPTGGTPTGGQRKGPSLTAYKGLVLTLGSTGEAVVAVQRLLGVTPVSGFFGPVTQAAVKTFQKAHGLPVTGAVGPLTWKALGA